MGARQAFPGWIMKQLHFASLAAPLALALASCGGGGSASTPGAVVVPSETATAPSPAPSPAPTPTPSVAAPPVLTEGARRFPPVRRVTAAVGLSLPIGRCMNVEYDNSWRKVEESDYAWFRRSGFDTIRLPVRFAAHTGRAAPYAIEPGYLAAVRRVADVAVAADLNLIVDLHHYRDFFADPAGERPRFLAIWRQIAEAFRDADQRVYFELLNEPQPPVNNAELTALYNEVIPIIRRTNPTRPIIVDTEKGSTSYNQETFRMPDDPYVMPTVHTYEPNSFTFQYDPYYSKGPVPTGVDFGSEADFAVLARQRARIAAFMQASGTVPFVGEFGAYQDIPLAQRINYLDAATNSFASLGIGSCVWAYSSGFTLRDDNGWLPGIVESLAKPLD